MGKYLADIVAAGTENSEDRISSSALEGAACQSAACFHMPDPGLDGAAPSEELCEHEYILYFFCCDIWGFAENHASLLSSCAALL